MSLNIKILLLLNALLVLQSTILAHPTEDHKKPETTTIGSTQLKPTKDLIPDTPGVRKFKNDLFNQLVLNFSNEQEDTYVAQKSSSEIDLPCTNDTVRIKIISSNFPLPERFYHAKKRCSEEVA